LGLSNGVIGRLLVEPGSEARLAERDTGWKGGPELKRFAPGEAKERAAEELREDVRELAEAQERLWASDSRSLLLVFQAMDAAGKDGTIKHVMSGVNPQGVRVVSFKQPSAEDLDHDFLWRISKHLPERGQIGIFNRSHYEEVLVVRVHPEFLEAQKLPPGPRGKEFWRHRYDSINSFERHLDRTGTKIVKFFLHVSKEEQKQRFLARLDDPDKEWKFSAADLRERAHWDEYMAAYEAAITATSTPWAPWCVIPADHKWVMRALVAGIVVDAIQGMGLAYPEVSDDAKQELAQARRTLEAEPD
jgi:PPK2 family polyphosphate:nucleotide phosphotransferase